LSAQQLGTSLLVAAGYYDGLQTAAGAKAPSDPAALRARLESQYAGSLTFLVKNLGGGTEAAPAGVAEALFEANNREFAEFLNKGGLGTRLAALSDEALVGDLFLRVLSRPATSEETVRLRRYLQARPNRRTAACEQALWALVTSSEFRFNH
jgi:hypothetical protein